MKKTAWIALGLLLLAPLLSHAVSPGTSEAKEWKEALLKEREDKDTYFKTSPVSPMAGLLRETIDKEDTLFLQLKNNALKFTLKETESPLLRVSYNGSVWSSRDSFGKNTILKKSGDTFKVDRFTFRYYLTDTSFILVAFDPERKMIREFSHLLYFKPNRKFRVKAKLEKYKEIKKRVVKTSRDLEKTLIEYGKVRFMIEGKELSLTAFKFTSDKNHPN